MSGYFRRLIASRILRTLYEHGRLSEVEAERLERNVALLVRTQEVFFRSKTRLDDPLYRIDADAISKVTGIKCDQEIISSFIHSLDYKDGGLDKVQQEKSDLLLSVNIDMFHQRVLHAIQNEGSDFGSRLTTDVARERPSKCVVVEYSSPNIAKPFHAGHLRSTIIGNFISNLYEHVGHSVHRLNYLGDWGTQFGLLAVGFQRYGSEEMLKEDPLLHLFQVYVRINKEVEEEKKDPSRDMATYREGLEVFSRLEQGDPELLRLWKRLRELSLEEYMKMYQRLGVKFSQIEYESDYGTRTQALLSFLKDQELLKFNKDGVGYMTVTDQGKEIQARLVKSDGSSLYLARDVSAALERQAQYSPDMMHYVVEGGQQFHFRQLLGILQQLKVPWAFRPVDEVHVQFGRVEGMSSRRGSVVFLRDIIDEAVTRIAEDMLERKTTRVNDIANVAEHLAVSAVIVQDLKARRRSNYTFNWERMLSFGGDSGIFLHLIDNCGVEKSLDIDVSCLREESTHQLVWLLARYPEVIEEMLTSLEPCAVVQYLLKLSHNINEAYSALRVKGENPDVAQARLLMFDCGRQVLANGLNLLGLQPLREM